MNVALQGVLCTVTDIANCHLLWMVVYRIHGGKDGKREENYKSSRDQEEGGCH